MPSVSIFVRFGILLTRPARRTENLGRREGQKEGMIIEDITEIDEALVTRDPKPDLIAEAKAKETPEPHFGIAFKVERYKDKIPEASNDDYWIRDNRFMFLVRGKFMSKEEADIWMNDNMRADYPTAFVIEIKDGKRVN